MRYKLCRAVSGTLAHQRFSAHFESYSDAIRCRFRGPLRPIQLFGDDIAQLGAFSCDIALAFPRRVRE